MTDCVMETIINLYNVVLFLVQEKDVFLNNLSPPNLNSYNKSSISSW